jgi:hypothetical protein
MAAVTAKMLTKFRLAKTFKFDTRSATPCTTRPRRQPPTPAHFCAALADVLLGEVLLRLRQGERVEVQPGVETLPLAAGH